MDDLQTRLQYYAAGTTVSVKVMRPSGQEYVEQEFTVTLGHAATAQGEDSNAGEEGGQGQYDGSQQPAMPGTKGGNAQQPGQGNDGGH